MAKSKETNVTLGNFPAEENNKENRPEAISPYEYFNKLKDGIVEEKSENVLSLFNTAMQVLDRYTVTGQKAAAKIVYSNLVYLHKEFKLLELGVTNKYVELDMINTYIDKIADYAVVVCELPNYERPIPDELVDKVAKTRDIFDEFYVVFTDYTGEKRSKVEKERRDKDPILFGNIFIDGKVSPKMYYLGDWVDEYCDLTLDKMIEQMSTKGEYNRDDIVKNISNEELLKNIKEKLTKKNC